MQLWYNAVQHQCGWLIARIQHMPGFLLASANRITHDGVGDACKHTQEYASAFVQSVEQ